MNARLLLAACAAVLIAAPAAAQTDAGGQPALARASDRSHRGHDLITADDIAGQTARDAYDLVQRLHPDWLRGHAAATDLYGRSDPVMVYLDGVEVGTVSELRRMHPEAVGEMRFIPSDEAISRFGTGHSAGVILVSSR